MKFKFSKEFDKALKRLNGKESRSALSMIDEVEAATSIHQISDCRKLVGYDNVYRIRVGSRQAFFTFHIEIIDDEVFFRYLVPRGQAYGKHMQQLLHTADNE